MAIESIGSMQKVLETSSTNDWIKSADLSLLKPEDAGNVENMNELMGDEKIKSFGQFLTESVSSVNGLQEEANRAIQKLVSGQTKNIEETMLAVEKAEIAFKMMNQVRQKVVEAYREVMRMQI
jgi:flagellar hook-basal body complex protein FliE